MRAILTTDQPPWPYEGTSLEPLSGRPTFASLASRLSRFRRDGLIMIGTRLMWFVWQNDVAAGAPNMVTKISTPSLVALACMYGGSNDRPAPTEHEFRLLCWELHNCAEPSSSTLPEAQAARAVFAQRYDALPASHPLRTMPRGALDHAWVDYVLGLAVQAQQRPFAYMPSDIVRPFAIYERMRERVAGDARETLRVLETSFFGVPWEHFLRGFVYCIALSSADARGAICPGVIELRGTADDGSTGTPAPLDVRPSDLRVFLERLSTRVSTFPQMVSELEHMPEYARKYHPSVRTLDARPVIIVDDAPTDGILVAIPSPWHMRSAASAVVLDEFVAFAAQHSESHSLGPRPAFELRGDAFSSHLEATFAERNAGGVVALDRLYPASAGSLGKHPDFAWLGQRYGLLVEAKARLTPNSDSWGREPTSLFEAWERGTEALDQCVAYLRRGADGHLGKITDRKWIAVVVTLQPLAAEATALRPLVKRWGLLTNTGLEAFAVVSAAELEHFALFGDADDYAAKLAALWAALDPDSLVRSSEGVAFTEARVSRTIVETWGRVLPRLVPPTAWNAP